MSTDSVTPPNVTYSRYLPEPTSTSTLVFKSLMDMVSGGLGTGGDLVSGAVSGDLQTLLQTQMQVQREMQVVSMASNIEKSKHEMQMTAIRNIRVG